MEGILPHIIAIVICVLFSAYFSATETAFSSLNKTRLKSMAEKDNKKAALALSLAENYDKLISTILIGNNIVNIALASISTVMFVRICGDIGATVSTAVITVVVLIFGEISPKSIAKDMPERFAMFSAPLIRVLIWVLTPLNFLFSLWKKLLSKVFRAEDDQKISQEELLLLVEEVQQDGGIDTSEGDLLKNAIEFTERKAEDILIHRVDIEAIPMDADKSEIARIFTDTKFSRLPVYNESIDDIVGVIHQKDFYTNGKVIDGSIEEIMTPPVFVQCTVKINNLLKMLQKQKSHIAVVLDEYGGTYGIVTMEDILEELVGEIWDEHDEVVEEYKEISENTYQFDCSMNMDDFAEFFDKEIEAESVSLSGWVTEMLEKIPDVGDSFIYEDLSLTVLQTDAHRVETVEVRRLEEEVPEEAEA